MTHAQALPQAEWALIDDVPVFFSNATGPVRAALVFRVGWADEPVPLRGITHVVEHLSLVAVGQRAFEYNGMVEENRTTFYCSGTPEQVVEFFASVTQSLSQLPLERLQAETRILKVEADSRRHSSVDALRTWRFGARGPGASSFEEFGLLSPSADRVVDWAARWFTAGNASMWITSAPPAGLRLPLRSGARQPVATAQPIPFVAPGWVEGPDGGLAASMLVPREVGSSALEWILQRRLFERLRMQDAVSYSVQVQRRAVDVTSNELVVLVDGLPDSQTQLETGVVDIFDQLGSAGCTEQELTNWRDQYLRPLGEPQGVAGLLHQMVTDHLYGLPAKRAENVEHEAANVTPLLIRDAMAAAYATALFCVPKDSTIIAQRTTALPAWSTHAVTGQRFLPTNPSSAAVLIVGDDGVTYALDAERRATILWRDCAAALRWNDGGRRL